MIIDVSRLTPDAIDDLINQDVVRYAADEHPGYPRIIDGQPVIVSRDDADAMTEDLTNVWRLLFAEMDRESAAFETA
jgi:hypothetical protein